MYTSTALLLFTLSLTFQNIHAEHHTKCWSKSSNERHPSPNLPCGVVTPDSPFLPRCSPTDTCLPSGICHHTPTHSNSSSYYIGGCTDPTLSSPACNTHCSSGSLTDIIYNSTSQTWACCSVTQEGVVRCDEPTEEVFEGGAPGTGYYFAPTTTAASGSARLASVTGSVVVASGSGQSRGLGIGVLAAIGVGAAVGGIFIIGLLVFAAVRHRRRKQEAQRNYKEEQVSGAGARVGGGVMGNGVGNLHNYDHQPSPISTYTSMYTPAPTTNPGGLPAKPDDPFGVYRPRERPTIPQERLAVGWGGNTRHELREQEIIYDLP